MAFGSDDFKFVCLKVDRWHKSFVEVIRGKHYP